MPGSESEYESEEEELDDMGNVIVKPSGGGSSDADAADSADDGDEDGAEQVEGGDSDSADGGTDR